MRNKKLKIISLILSIIVLSLIIFTIYSYNRELEIKRENIEKVGLKIVIDNKEYPVKLVNNDTVLSIQKKLPIINYFTKYEDSVYYTKLENNIDIDGEIVSKVKSKSIYYHTGWKSIIIAYKDYTFKKQKLVYLGSIDKNIPSKNSIQKITIDTNKKD